MSITSLIPGRRDRRKHSPDAVIRNLRDENRRHLDRQLAADGYFELLLRDRADVYAAWEFSELARQEAEMAAACMQSERDEWKAEALALRARFGPQLAAEENAHPITVPPMVRDTSAVEDQATTPIDVRPLWEALGAGPTTAVTDPGHVPAL